jgi:hypothetical protein
MKVAKAFLLVLLFFLLEALITQPVASAQDPPSDTVWIAAPYTAFPMGISFPMSVEVSNRDTALSWLIMNFALRDTHLVELDSFSFSHPSCRLSHPDTMDERDTVRVDSDTVQLIFSDSGEDYLSADSGKIIDLWFSGKREGVFFIDTTILPPFPFSVGLYPKGSASPVYPAFLSESVRLFSHGHEVYVVPQDTVLPVGTRFRMSVDVCNSDSLYKMIMTFALKDTNRVRLDSFILGDRLSNPEILSECREIVRVAPDTIKLRFKEYDYESDFLPAGSGTIVNIWFSSIQAGSFSFEAIDTFQFTNSHGDTCTPDFIPHTVRFPDYSDPGAPDYLWIKKGVDQDTIGIKAKFALPVTACNDEILSGFEIPLLMVGNNLPSFADSFCFNDTTLTDTNVLRDVDTLSSDSVLVRLELKKPLTQTLLEPGDNNELFDLWFKANDSPGKFSIYPDFVPHLGNLLFIDDSLGFIPASCTLACTTFSYVPGDITRNDVVNNVDLFYLAVHLFLPPDDTSMGKLIYDPEDLERIKSQKAFQRSEIPSEEWDSTFSQILFRGDVNGDSRVDMGDFYIMSRHFQAGTSGDLEYGWFDPQAVEPCNNDTVRLNFRKAYPGQKIQILVEIYNQDALAAVTVPLQIPDIAKIECDSVTLAGRFADLEYFDWEWITWDEDYDENPDNQDILISLSTLGISGFPHIPPSDTNCADSSFILWCTVKGTLLDESYMKLASLSPSHEITFFEMAKGYACQPQVHRFMVPTPLADYGDAPDRTNPCYAGCSFPTLCNTNCCRICGRQGPYHQYDPVCTEWLGTLTNPPDTEWVPMVPNMDQDDLTGTLYLQAGTTAWYIAPVTVTSDIDVCRYLNVLYDVDRNREWKEKEYTEWVVQNKLIIPSGASTDNIIIGPFEIDQPPTPSDTSWARFTLTKDSIPTAPFDTFGGWDGSGPSGGWDHGETEDIPFENCKGSSEFLIFSAALDSVQYQVGSEGKEVNVTVGLAGTKDEIIQRLALNWEIFDSSGQGNAVICSCISSDPAELTPDSFDLSGVIHPPPATVTFTYLATFPGTSNDRISRVLWKVTEDLGGGTKLVATAETEFEEAAEPYFVFLNTTGDTISWKDTTISYYGGVVDLRLYVVDPDNDYDIGVTFDRTAFQHAVYDPIFGESKYANEMIVSGPHDPLLFHWAADDTTDVDVGTRIAIFTAQEMVGEQTSVCDTLTIHVSDADSLLPDSNKVWVGRTGVIATQDLHFEVPVEVYNTTNLIKIELPFKIEGYTDVIDTSSYSWLYDDSRLSDPDTLNEREFDLSPPDTVIVKFEKDVGYYPLSSGFGRIFNLCFEQGRNSFQIDTLWKITFWESEEIQFEPAFESYEIRVIVEGEYVCGDVTGDGEVNLSDIVHLTKYLFKSGDPPQCTHPYTSCADSNGNGEVGLADVVHLINYVLKSGSPPICS